ncbi:MAG: hypothetical protein ABJF28_27410 [Nisaea sp.]
MVATQSVSPDTLSEIEKGFRAAWTGANSTPFLVDAPISPALRAEAENIARRLSLSVLFSRCPTLAVWAVLTPLSQSYGAATNDVYLHISRFVKDNFHDQSGRETLKRGYRIAARKIGLPVSGNDPTELFFAPLGPPLSRHADLAAAFVTAALSLGPPAIEDTPSARRWQRRAVRNQCPQLTRLHKTIEFDNSAHCARRFEAWRKGAVPLNNGEAALFEAYDRAAGYFGRKRTDLTGPPQIYWTGDRLAVEAERSSRPQSIKTGPFPVQIKSGARQAVSAPWPDALSWTCGSTSRAVPFGPGADQVLLFDADTGVMLARVEVGTSEIQIPASRLVALARRDFDSPSFGPALPATDPTCRVAWIEAGDTLSIADGPDLKIITPRETAIWIDGTPIGRSGSRALMSGDGAIMVKLDPEIGGNTRIVRARLGEATKYTTLKLAHDGLARILFAEFGFQEDAAPCKAIFEVLAPGAAGDFQARAELAVSTWLWPGLPAPSGAMLDLPLPENFNPARSAGLRIEGARLKVDLAADVDASILGLDIADETFEFTLCTGAEVLHHYSVSSKGKTAIPRGARISLGHQERHDSLILQSSDRDANLLILGREFRRPFFARSRFEITAELLETPEGADDRIAMRRKDGRVEIFARIERRNDPVDMALVDTDTTLTFSLMPQQRCDALRIRVEPACGPVVEGDYIFGRHLANLGRLSGVEANQDVDTGRLEIEVKQASYPHPARLTLWARQSDKSDFYPIEDGRGLPVALGLGKPFSDPDPKTLGALAALAAQPSSAHLEQQNARTIGAAYRAAMEHIGARRMVGAIRPALATVTPGRATPRHDLVGVAPWAFEVTPHAYQGLPDACGLAALSRLATTGRTPHVPNPDGDAPLAQWLTRLQSDDGLPDDLSAASLASAFGALRYRLVERDLGFLLSDDRQGLACGCICAAWVEDLDALRAYDTGGGGDARPARIAATLERFARACAQHRSSQFLDDIAFRTGLSPSEIGECMTLMLRAGIEIFVYFRGLWSQFDFDRKDA